MDESGASLGGLRPHLRGQRGEDVAERVDRVDHHALGRAGMRAHAAERDRREPRAPRLVVDLAERVAVDRVGIRRAERRDVEAVHARADLLVRRERDLDRAVRDRPVVEQGLGHRHDRRDARLVVRAEQRCAVGRDQIVADHRIEHRMLRRSQDLRRIAGQRDVAALVVRVHDGRHVRAAHRGRRIDVRDERDHGHGLGVWNGRRNRRGDVTVLAQRDVHRAERRELAREHPRERPLPRRARRRRLALARLGVDSHVPQETSDGIGDRQSVMGHGYRRWAIGYGDRLSIIADGRPDRRSDSRSESGSDNR